MARIILLTILILLTAGHGLGEYRLAWPSVYWSMGLLSFLRYGLSCSVLAILSLLNLAIVDDARTGNAPQQATTFLLAFLLIPATLCPTPPSEIQGWRLLPLWICDCSGFAETMLAWLGWIAVAIGVLSVLAQWDTGVAGSLLVGLAISLCQFFLVPDTNRTDAEESATQFDSEATGEENAALMTSGEIDNLLADLHHRMFLMNAALQQFASNRRQLLHSQEDSRRLDVDCGSPIQETLQKELAEVEGQVEVLQAESQRMVRVVDHVESLKRSRERHVLLGNSGIMTDTEYGTLLHQVFRLKAQQKDLDIVHK